MQYRFYYRIEGQAEIKKANTLPEELVDLMVKECFIDDSVIFYIVAHDEVQDMDIPYFYGTRSQYDKFQEKQKTKKHIIDKGETT